MAIKQIVKYPAQILSEKCKEVEVIDESILSLLDDLYDTMIEYDGVGIAAPQINVPLQVAIAEIGENHDILEMINPVVLKTKGKDIDIEGCLSFPGLFGDVERPTYVKIEACDRTGQVYQLEAFDYDARVILHEIDHLNGILFNEKILKTYTEEELEQMFEEEEK